MEKFLHTEKLYSNVLSFFYSLYVIYNHMLYSIRTKKYDKINIKGAKLHMYKYPVHTRCWARIVVISKINETTKERKS